MRQQGIAAHIAACAQRIKSMSSRMEQECARSVVVNCHRAPNKSLKLTASNGAASQLTPVFGSLRAARSGGSLAPRYAYKIILCLH